MRIKIIVSKILVIAIAAMILGMLLIWALNINVGVSNTHKKKMATDEIKIGFVMNAMFENRWAIEKEVFENRIIELGAKPIVKVGLYDSAAQKNYILELIEQGVSVIVVIPQNNHDLQETLVYAYNQGVKIILYDELVENTYVDIFITLDYHKAGQLIKEQLLWSNGVGKNLIISGTNDAYSTTVLAENIIETGQQEKIERAFAQNANVNEAIRNVENATVQFEVDQVVVPTDECAAAIINRGLLPNSKIYSIGGDLPSLRRIENLEQEGAIYLPVTQMANLAAEYSVAIANDQYVRPLNATVIQNGDFDISAIIMDVIYINCDNVTLYLDDRMEESQITYENTRYKRSNTPN